MFVHYHSVGSRNFMLGVLGDDGGSVFCGILRYNWAGTGTVMSTSYRSVGAITVMLGVLGCGVTFDALVWRYEPWFLVASY